MSRKTYLWIMDAKLYMGIYFTALAIMAGIIFACFGKNTFSVMTLFEMLIVAILIAITQVLILPQDHSFEKGIFSVHAVSWLILSGILTGGVSLLFDWFAGLPIWCNGIMAAFIILGCIAMLTGLRMQREPKS